MTTIYQDVEVDEYFFPDVAFEGKVIVEKPEYEGLYRFYDGAIYCENIMWDKDKYSPLQNTIISDWLEINFSKVEEKIIKEAQNEFSEY